jgi:cytochrome c oxidase subunit 4
MTDVDAPSTPEPSSPEHQEHHLLQDHHAAPGHDGEHGEHDQVTDSRYMVIAFILAAITAAEVAASYIDIGPLFIPMLLVLMAIKFFVVVSFFMHLRFDNRVFTWMFYSGVFLALAVYLAALATFRFFEG